MDAYAGNGMLPQIEASDNAFKVTLPNLNFRGETKEPERLGPKNDENIEKVFTLVTEQGFATRKEIEKLLGISQTTCGRLLRQMIENGQIVQEGKGKNTHYRLPQ